MSDTYLLTLDSPPPSKGYKELRIGGQIYQPLYTHNVGRNDVGVRGRGGFVGKEVEFS